MKPGLTVEVWYAKPMFFHVGSSCYTGDLNDTHVLLKTVEAHNLEDVFAMMQGENWSPNGEANSLIREKGLAHTSMSVGDAVVVDGEVYFVAMLGFAKVEML